MLPNHPYPGKWLVWRSPEKSQDRLRRELPALMVLPYQHLIPEIVILQDLILDLFPFLLQWPSKNVSVYVFILKTKESREFSSLFPHMEENLKRELRRFTGEHNRWVWEVAKTGDLSDLSGEDKKLAEIMLEHGEFHKPFEIADVLSEHEYDPDKEINPFLHVTIHAIIETQLGNKAPIEVVQFYNAMRKKKASRHDAMHLIGVILVPFIWKTLREQRLFDLEAYRSRLKNLKYMKPEKNIRFKRKRRIFDLGK